MKDRSKDHLEAEVILRPAQPGASIEQTIQAQAVDRFDSPPEALEKVIGDLKNFGFEVIAQSSNSISIAGPRASFERVFRMDPESETLIVPREIKDQVEGVYLQSPSTYFER